MRLRSAVLPEQYQQDVKRIVPYVEFQSTMLKLMAQVHKQHLSIKAAFELFANDKQHSKMMFVWPHHDAPRDISVSYVLAGNNPTIELAYKNEKFLTLAFKNSHSIDAVIHHSIINTQQWTIDDMKEWVATFNQVLQARNIIYPNESQHCLDAKSPTYRTRFTKNDFQQIISQYQHHELTYRIENTIIKHAKRRGENYSFQLDWPDSLQVNHALKMTFSRVDHFHSKYSWVIDERTLLSRFFHENKNMPTNQCYYSFSVNELMTQTDTSNTQRSPKQQEIEILSVWLAVDGLVGEMRDLKKGKHISGNEVLAIYDYFDQLFKVKHTLICDESRINDDTDETRIPLRLISALCTGKTWYESKLPGVRLFECRNFKSAHDGVFTQSVDHRNQVLKELQQLSLADWYNMLDQESKPMLLNLLKKDVAEASLELGNVTLKQLAISLLNESKEKRMLTSRLKNFTSLLCDDMHKDKDRQPNHKHSDFWLKSRVWEILWGGYFWVKESTPEIQLTRKC